MVAGGRERRGPAATLAASVARRVLDLLRHPIASNALSLYAVQVAITLIPLLILPYLARVLGPAEFGVVVFTQSFGFLLNMVPEFGFGLSGAREVARARDDRERVGAFVAGVQGAKAALALLATLLALASWPLVPAFREDPTLLLLGVLLMLSGAFHPLWYFVGVERLKLLAASDVAIRLASAAAILLLVREADDGELVLLIWIAGAALSTAVLTAVMYREVPLRRPTRRAAQEALRGGAALFVSGAAVSMYTSGVVFLLGVVTTSAQVAFFAAAERIVRVAVRILSQVGGATFPRINYLLGQGREDRANQLALVTLAILGAVALLAAIALVALAPAIVRVFYGQDFEPAIAVLRILALVVPLSIVASTLGTQWLLTRHLDRPATLLLVLVGVATAVSVLLAAPEVGIEGVAWILIAAEALVVAGNLVLIRKARITLPRRGAAPSPASERA